MATPEQPTAEHLQRGIAGEITARTYLEARGLSCLAAGWRCRLGELDLIMQDSDTLVFVEVRWRRAGSLVRALDSVSPAKQQRMVRAASAWLSRNPRAAELPARFDVIAIDGTDIQWLRDAFTTSAR